MFTISDISLDNFNQIITLTENFIVWIMKTIIPNSLGLLYHYNCKLFFEKYEDRIINAFGGGIENIAQLFKNLYYNKSYYLCVN